MQYIWLIWSLLLLAIWLFVFLKIREKQEKKKMLLVSFWTAFLGLTEPLFVPEYWSPPSLFDLALRTGFDIESIIFAFGIGGLAAVIYERIFNLKNIKVSDEEKNNPRHRYHLFALLAAPVIFVPLLIFSDLNPIYSAFIALILGGLFTWYCRPDLKIKMFISALIFTVIYFIYFLTLFAIAPGYVEMVWNMGAISGVLIFGVPLEELMFAFGFGFMWSSIYEHITWRKIIRK